MKKILKWVGIIVVVIIVIGIFSGGSKTNTSKTTTSGSVTEAPVKPSGVTMEQFNSISEGMTYDEVVKALGSEGEVQSSNEIGGIKTVMYMWKGTSLGSNMNATFQDGKMMSKAQFGLK